MLKFLNEMKFLVLTYYADKLDIWMPHSWIATNKEFIKYEREYQIVMRV